MSRAHAGILPTDRAPTPASAPRVDRLASATGGTAHEHVTSTLPIDRGQETDVWWGGYAGRAMLGSFLVCSAVTVGAGIGLWLLWGQVDTERRRLLVWGTEAGLIAMWLFQTIRWAYRMAFFTFRVTNQRLFRDRGVLYPRWQEIPLAEVARVEVTANQLERLLWIGRVRLVTPGQPESVLELEGVASPRLAADRLRGVIARAAEGRVTGGRVAVESPQTLSRS